MLSRIFSGKQKAYLILKIVIAQLGQFRYQRITLNLLNVQRVKSLMLSHDSV